jgi:hypothetical protein
MRFAITGGLLAALSFTACGDHGPAPRTPAPATNDLPALAFAPEHPTYALGAPTARALLAFAPIAPPAGIDLDASAAVFSDHLDPTIVFRVADAAAVRAALAQLPPTAWNISGDWLAIHFDIFGDAPGWAARGKGLAGDAWAWAKQHASASAGVLGFVDLNALAATVPRVGAAAACVHLAEPLGRVALSLDGGLTQFAVHATSDLGPAASAVVAATLPPPSGWAGTAQGAPLAAQVNVDLQALEVWAAPCERALAIEPPFATTGLRAARVLLQSIDPGKQTGTGAIALDLGRNDHVAQLLDQIPLRKQLESDRMFGSHAGHRIAIPFTATIDYVLEDHLALAAMGDGLLDRITAPAAAPATPPPLFEIDVIPSRLSRQAWEWLAELANVPRALAARVAALHEAHAALALSGTTLALDVSFAR